MSSVPRSRSTDKRFYGVVEGLVTDNADPDREGKVRVKFPWFDSQTISEWCRILQPYAGSRLRALLRPRDRRRGGRRLRSRRHAAPHHPGRGLQRQGQAPLAPRRRDR